MSAQTGKDVIYIDIDDEITALIDHVRSAKQRIVALVLPKRAAVLQSIVNMKLLKRTADDAKKHLVLITTETGVVSLAGAVGVYVAKSLQSKPEVPHVPKAIAAAAADEEEAEDTVSMADGTDEEEPLDTAKPVGAYMAAGAASDFDSDEEESIELDNTASHAPKEKGKKDKAPKQKKDKKLAIPDFNKFRLWLILGGVGVVLLGVFLFLAIVVLPKATVTIKTDSSAVAINADLTFDTKEGSKLNATNRIVPATSVTTEKSASQTANTTGQLDKGEKATGSVTLTLKDCSTPSITIPAGTGVQSNGLTFLTQQSATLFSQTVTKKGVTTCANDSDANATVGVTAQTGGDKYNIAGGSQFTVPGNKYSSVTGVGSKMNGGTSNIVQVLAQADIDAAKQKLSAADTSAIKTELAQKLKEQGLYAVNDTFAGGDPQVTPSAVVGAEVTSVTITQKTTYSMLGVQESDLKQVVTNEVNKQIDPTKEKILDYGLAAATFKLENQNDGKVLVTMGDTAVAGSDLDLSNVKKQIAGLKSNAARELITKNPGVTNVRVTYSPFWVSSIPKNTTKITVTVEKPPVKNAN